MEHCWIPKSCTSTRSAERAGRLVALWPIHGRAKCAGRNTIPEKAPLGIVRPIHQGTWSERVPRHGRTSLRTERKRRQNSNRHRLLSPYCAFEYGTDRDNRICRCNSDVRGLRPRKAGTGCIPGSGKVSGGRSVRVSGRRGFEERADRGEESRHVLCGFWRIAGSCSNRVGTGFLQRLQNSQYGRLQAVV